MIKLAICLLPTMLCADFYTVPSKLHIGKDGTAIIEVEGHYFDIKNIDHSDMCPCMEYVIDPSIPHLD